MLNRKWINGGGALSLAMLAVGPAYAQSQPLPCSTAYPNVTNGKTVRPVTAIYSSTHLCGLCPRLDKPLACENLDRLLVPDVDMVGGVRNRTDILPIPHRGLWGPHERRMATSKIAGEGPAENTMGALNAAIDESFRIIEIDVAVARPAGEAPYVFLGHYFSMAAVGGDRGVDPTNVTRDVLHASRMRKRDQSRSDEDDDRIASLENRTYNGETIQGALALANIHGLILMIDPKIPEVKDNGSGDTIAVQESKLYHDVIGRTLTLARAKGSLPNVVIKTTYSATESKNRLRDWFSANNDDISNYWGKFLWSPIINKDENVTASSAKQFIDDWMNIDINEKIIATFEVGLYNYDHWSAQCFYNKKNLAVYVLDVTKHRPAIWSVDSMGDKGTFGRVYTWKFIGNTPTDKRGNAAQNLNYDGYQYFAINTDRPDYYSNKKSGTTSSSAFGDANC